MSKKFVAALGVVVLVILAFVVVPGVRPARANISTCFTCNQICEKDGVWGCCQELPGNGCMAWGVCI